MSGTTISKAAVIFQDNFDGYADSPINHGWGALGGNVSAQKGIGYRSSRGIKIAYTKSGTTPYWFGFSIARYTTLEIYVRFYFKIDATPTGGCKFLKIFGKTFDPEGYANSTFGLNQWAFTLKALAYGDGSGLRNDTQDIIKFSGSTTDSLVVIKTRSGPFNPVDNKWHTYEGHVKFNSNGKRDGVYDVWIDGIQMVHATNVRNRNDLNSQSIGSVQLGNYCGRTFSTPWNLYIDNVIASTTPPPPLPVKGFTRN